MRPNLLPPDLVMRMIKNGILAFTTRLLTITQKLKFWNFVTPRIQLLAQFDKRCQKEKEKKVDTKLPTRFWNTSNKERNLSSALLQSFENYGNRLYLTIAKIALTPSFHPIFLPSA